MALKTLKFNLPDGNVINVDLEETFTVKALMEHLRVEEILDANGNFEVQKIDGSPILEQNTFALLQSNEFNIRDLNSVPISNPQLSVPIFAPVGIPSVPRFFHQLGLLVLDGSGSMTEKAARNSTKAKEVNAAVIELFNRLNVSRVKQNFSFACIKFDVAATVSLPPIPFDFNQLMNENFDPTVGKGGGTQISEGLKEAKKLADNFLNSAPPGSVPHKVLILLMSDGMCFSPQTTISAANSLKSDPRIQIACAYFGTVGNNDTDAQNALKDICTDPGTYYTTVYDGDALRAFFERSISQSAGIKIE